MDVIQEVDSAPSCPFHSQPTCPVAPGAIDCAGLEIGCGLDSLPAGLSCLAPAQCSALIYPCPDWQSHIGFERTDGYICSCVGGRWSCDDCWLGNAGWFCDALGACARPTDANQCALSADGAAGE
jgi:hypothetical protein